MSSRIAILALVAVVLACSCEAKKPISDMMTKGKKAPYYANFAAALKVR